MKLKSRLLLLATVALVSVSASAIELPVTNIGGIECYYYNVKPKETVFSICRELGITRSELVNYNPSVSDGLRAGQTLYFPVDKLKNVSRKNGEEIATLQPAQAKQQTKSASAGAKKARTHLVKKGETIYGITHQYGITEEQLFALNPSIEQNGLKRGKILTLPDENATAATETTQPQKNEEPVTVSPTETPIVTDTPQTGTPSYSRHDRASLVEATDTVTTATQTDSVPMGMQLEVDSLRIAIMLPFMLNEDNPSKQAQLYTEFYRGFLMAADSLRNSGLPVHISAHDTYGLGAGLGNLLQDNNVKKADVIIAPDVEEQLDALARFGAENSINILNIFAVRNSVYTTNSTILQANIPHSMMYSNAISELLKTFPDYQPVFLIPCDGKTDKIEFISAMRESLGREEKSFIEVNYEGMLDGNDLSQLDRSQRYIFIPASGSQTEFSKIIGAVKAYKESLDDFSLVQLFGYPEWITFRKESLDNMHFMNATIYSRFFNDQNSNRSRSFNEEYVKWFGHKPLNAIPVQGILGFDTGIYLLRALNDNAAHDSDFELYYDGIQNNYHFANPEEVAGKVNDSLYFINFRPSGIIDRRAI